MAEVYYKVHQVLQSVADYYYIVGQVLQSTAVITKWDVVALDKSVKSAQ